MDQISTTTGQTSTTTGPGEAMVAGMRDTAIQCRIIAPQPPAYGTAISENILPAPTAIALPGLTASNRTPAATIYLAEDTLQRVTVAGKASATGTPAVAVILVATDTRAASTTTEAAAGKIEPSVES